MSNATPPAASQPAHLWPLFLAISGFIVLRFVWAVAVPGGGWPVSPVHYMAMAADFMMTVGIFGLRAQLLPAMADEDGRRATIRILFPLAVISGIGLLLIRLTSDAAWWTGHLYN